MIEMASGIAAWIAMSFRSCAEWRSNPHKWQIDAKAKRPTWKHLLKRNLHPKKSTRRHNASTSIKHQAKSSAVSKTKLTTTKGSRPNTKAQQRNPQQLSQANLKREARLATPAEKLAISVATVLKRRRHGAAIGAHGSLSMASVGAWPCPPRRALPWVRLPRSPSRTTVVGQ